MITDLDAALIDWLESHHIRAKDVTAWSGESSAGDLTKVTITFHVSGVDFIPEPVRQVMEWIKTSDAAKEGVAPPSDPQL